MGTLSSSGLPLPELMKLSLHRLHSGLDVVPGVPRRRRLDLALLGGVHHLVDVHRVDRRPLLASGRRGRGGRGGARHRVELVVAVDAARVHVSDVQGHVQGSLEGRMVLILELEPAADRQGRRWGPVGRRSPLGDGAAAARTLVLLRRVLASEARAARSALRRGLEVRGGRELGRRPGVPGVSRGQPCPGPAGRHGWRRGRQRLDRHEALRLRVYGLERGQLLAVALVDRPQLDVTGRGREARAAPLDARVGLAHRAQVAQVDRRGPGRRLGPVAGRARQEPRRRNGADGGGWQRHHPRAVAQRLDGAQQVVGHGVGDGRHHGGLVHDGESAALGAQAELTGADEGTPPRGLEPLVLVLAGQKATVVAARGVEDAVVGRRHDRVRDDEATVGRPGYFTQRPAATGDVWCRWVYELAQKI